MNYRAHSTPACMSLLQAEIDAATSVIEHEGLQLIPYMFFDAELVGEAAWGEASLLTAFNVLMCKTFGHVFRFELAVVTAADLTGRYRSYTDLFRQTLHTVQDHLEKMRQRAGGAAERMLLLRPPTGESPRLQDVLWNHVFVHTHTHPQHWDVVVYDNVRFEERDGRPVQDSDPGRLLKASARGNCFFDSLSKLYNVVVDASSRPHVYMDEGTMRDAVMRVVRDVILNDEQRAELDRHLQRIRKRNRKSLELKKQKREDVRGAKVDASIGNEDAPLAPGMETILRDAPAAAAPPEPEPEAKRPRRKKEDTPEPPHAESPPPETGAPAGSAGGEDAQAAIERSPRDARAAAAPQEVTRPRRRTEKTDAPAGSADVGVLQAALCRSLLGALAAAQSSASTAAAGAEPAGGRANSTARPDSNLGRGGMTQGPTRNRRVQRVNPVHDEACDAPYPLNAATTSGAPLHAKGLQEAPSSAPTMTFLEQHARREFATCNGLVKRPYANMLPTVEFIKTRGDGWCLLDALQLAAPHKIISFERGRYVNAIRNFIDTAPPERNRSSRTPIRK